MGGKCRERWRREEEVKKAGRGGEGGWESER